MNDINKYGIDYTARFGNESNKGGYRNTGLTQKGYNVAQTGFNDKLTNLQQAALAQGISPEDFQVKLDNSLQAAQKFYQGAERRFQKEDNRGGFLGFLDKATPVVTQAGFAYLGGNLLPGTIPSTMTIPGTSVPLGTASTIGNTALKIYDKMDKSQSGYAEGGSVTAYDSDRVDAIVNQFM